jgi:hypothetical protein
LTAFRSLSTKEQNEWQKKMNKPCPEKLQGVEYKGILVVPLENIEDSAQLYGR